MFERVAIKNIVKVLTCSSYKRVRQNQRTCNDIFYEFFGLRKITKLRECTHYCIEMRAPIPAVYNYICGFKFVNIKSSLHSSTRETFVPYECKSPLSIVLPSNRGHYRYMFRHLRIFYDMCESRSCLHRRMPDADCVIERYRI
jgi:hypothetical protein